MPNRLRAWGPAALWCGVLFFLSARPFQGHGWWWLDVNDKLLHLVIYTVLGATLAYARVHSPETLSHLTMIALGALFAISDEWHQSFVPGRSPSIGDWVADVAGVTLGYWLTLVLVLGQRSGRPVTAKEDPE